MNSRKDIIEERYQDLLSWYDKNKTNSRIFYYTFQVAVILCSALTPIVMIVVEPDELLWLKGLLPSIAAISASLLTLFKFNETWLSRAQASENLKSEYVFYKSRVGTLYSCDMPEDEAESNFLKRIEIINSAERTVWVSIRESTQIEEEESYKPLKRKN